MKSVPAQHDHTFLHQPQLSKLLQPFVMPSLPQQMKDSENKSVAKNSELLERNYIRKCVSTPYVEMSGQRSFTSTNYKLSQLHCLLLETLKNYCLGRKHQYQTVPYVGLSSTLKEGNQTHFCSACSSGESQHSLCRDVRSKVINQKLS